MALTRITEGVIKPNENYVVNNINSSGVTTSTNFKTGTSNLHNVGIEIAGINVLGADTPIGTGATIYDAGGALFTGVVTATSFSGSGNIGGVDGNFSGNVTGVDATFSGNVSVGGTLTYEDVTNIDSVGLITARGGITLSGGNISLADRPDGNSHNLFFGTGARAAAYHDGTNFTVINNTGHTYIGVGAANKDLMLYAQSTGNIILQRNTGHKYFEGVGSDGTAKIYHNTNEKIRTTNTGAVVTGILTATSFKGDGSALTGLNPDKIIEGNSYAEVLDTGTNGIFRFLPEGIEKFRITTDGKVGIGTYTPAQKLDIRDGDLVLSHSAAGTNHRTSFIEFTGSYARINSVMNQGSTASSNYTAGWNFTTRNYTGSAFETLTPFTIQANGRVGVGTAEPLSVLTAYGENRGEGTVTGQITAKDNAAYNASPTGGLIFQGHYHSNGANAIFAGITGFKENGSDGNYAGALGFHVRANGAVAYEAVRITSNGRVNIGTGQLDQTDRMLNVYGGRARISGIPANSNSFEVYANSTTGQSHGMLIDAGTNSSDINSHFRQKSGATLFKIRGDGNIGVGADTPARKVHVKNAGIIKLENTSTGGWLGLEFLGSSGTNNYDAYMGVLDSNGLFFIDNNSNGNDICINRIGKVFIGADATDFSDAGSFLNIKNDTYGGRIAFSNNTATAGVALMEQFAYWGSNKVAGTIISAGTDTSNKDDANMKFYTASAGVVKERIQIKSDGAFSLTSENTTGWLLKAGQDASSYSAIDGHFATTNRTLYLNQETTHRSFVVWNKNGSDGYGFGLDSTNFKVVKGSNERLRIDSDGKVRTHGATDIGHSGMIYIQGLSDPVADETHSNLTVRGEGGNGFACGTYEATGNYGSWIQAGYVPNFTGGSPAATYPLILNPNGNCVCVGNYNDASTYDAGLLRVQSRHGTNFYNDCTLSLEHYNHSNAREQKWHFISASNQGTEAKSNSKFRQMAVPYTSDSTFQTHTDQIVYAHTVGHNQYCWYKFNTRASSSPDRGGSARIAITWSTRHAAGTGYGEYSFAWLDQHNTSRVDCFLRKQHFLSYNGGTYYGWSSNPEVVVYSCTGGGSAAGFYLRLRGHGSHNGSTYDMGTIHNFHIIHNDNNAGGNNSYFEFVSNASGGPSDASSVLGFN